MCDLIVTGDSWMFGSEIIDPSIETHIDEWDILNTKYREKHIFPTLLSQKLNINFKKNLSFPADSNDKIFRKLYNYLYRYYIKNSKLSKDVFVVVQLSSFDRRDFHYKGENDGVATWKTIWPNWEHDYLDFAFNKFADTYSRLVQSDLDNLRRYLDQILAFQNFCKVYKIPYLIVQGFYHTNYSPKILEWYDSKYINIFNESQYERQDDENTPYFQGSSEPELWDEVDSIRFMNKDLENHSLHSILKEKNDSSLFYDVHPSEKGHEVIAEYIENYIKKYKLLSFN